MKQLFDYQVIERTLKRMTHEILERNEDYEDLVLLGIKKNGTPVAKMLQRNILAFEDIEVPCYELDISPYRDDHATETDDRLNISLKNKNVIIVDDVLYTGRSVRAAMDAVVDLGRPKRIQVAVLIDRGHRELPIRADYIGKNIPTRFDETIVVKLMDQKGVYLSTK